MVRRKLKLPAAATTSALLLAACVLGGAAAGPAAATAPASADAPAVPAAAPTTPATLQPPTAGTPDATVADPAKADASAPAAPAAPATPATPAAASAPKVTLSSYDPSTGSAVLAPAPSAPAATLTAPSAGGQSAAAPSAAPAIAPGQLIDSPPTAAAPHGALVAVTGVQPAADGTVVVSTRPATLPELLGSTNAALHSALDPSAFHIEPKVQGIRITTDLGAAGGQGTITGGIGLTVDATVPTSNGSSATLGGSVELDPTIDFSYQGGLGAIDPQQARVGFALGAHADWHVNGTFTGGTAQRIPIAEFTASPVVMVGALPVVINLDFTLSADISADGTVTIDAEQSYDGTWGVHSDYVKGPGWTTTTDPGTSTVSPLKLNLSGAATVKAGLLAEGSIALYDTVGVKASIEPYLRLAANGSVVLDAAHTTPLTDGTVTLYGGLRIDGALMARLVILGTPVLEKDLPFLDFRREWQIVSLTTGNAPAPAVTWTALDANTGDDNRSAYLRTQADWDYGAYKASCPDGSRLVGTSNGGDRGLCTNAVKPGLWGGTHTLQVVHDSAHVGADFAPGFAKLQCPEGYFATGYSRNGRTMGLLCAESTVPLGTSGRTVRFDSGDSRPAGAAGGDFAYGYAKGQCADDEYLAGIAYTQPWYALWESRTNALLCRKLA